MIETMQVVGKIIITTTKTTVRMLFEGRRVIFLEAVVGSQKPLPHFLAQGNASVRSKAAMERRQKWEQHVWGRTGLSSEQKEKECSGKIRYKALLTVPWTSTGCKFSEAVERWRKVQNRGTQCFMEFIHR